jgi:hypothetical protein
MNTDHLTNLKLLEQRFATHVKQLHATETVTYLDQAGFCVRQAVNGVKKRVDQVACAPLTVFETHHVVRAGR